LLRTLYACMSIQKWAEACFGQAKLNDVRRTRRLVAMAADAARRPAGKVTEVFKCPARRQAAYDLLEHDQIDPSAVSASLFDATAWSARKQERVFVAVDGSSLTLTDEGAQKGFGHIGSIAQHGRGMKVMNALALQPDGVPLGLVDQIWWTRQQRVQRKSYRPRRNRESMHWRAVVSNVGERFKRLAPKARVHFLFDREGDASLLIRHVVASGHEFTCRAVQTRKAVIDGRFRNVRYLLQRQRPRATMRVSLPATATRRARVATLDIFVARLRMVMRDRCLKKRRLTWLTVVWARERGRCASRGGLDWFLYTNVPVRSTADACDVVARYALRWRIEEFHRAWKSGVCRVEESQLRSPAAIIKWATILAAVATRAEQLRLRSRVAGDEPASTEFSDDELLALVNLHSEIHPRAVVPVEGLTLATAVRWVADLGGYVGSKASGPPGTVTIARGLEPLAIATTLIARLRAAGKLR
jgi:hypothetical protein